MFSSYDVITIGAATRDVFIKSKLLEIQESDSEPRVLEACFPMGAKIDIDELVFETGGGATNAAATFARLGFKTAAICAIGNDSNGKDVLRALKNDNISTRFVQQIKNADTAYSIVIVAGSGERTILVHRGAAQKISNELIPWQKIKAKWLYITSLGGDLDLLRQSIEVAVRNGIKVAWNPGNAEIKHGLKALAPLISDVDVFNLNREEAATLINSPAADLHQIFSILRQLPKRLLVITDGQAGAYSTEHEGDILLTSAMDFPRSNTTGAGDAFGSGLIAGLMTRNYDIKYALAVAIWNATGCIRLMGAKRGLLEKYPSDQEINQIITQPWKS
ncbi:MAG: carbohydrate kinase family protein [Patescibacteria group bacterium]